MSSPNTKRKRDTSSQQQTPEPPLKQQKQANGNEVQATTQPDNGSATAQQQDMVSSILDQLDFGGGAAAGGDDSTTAEQQPQQQQQQEQVAQAPALRSDAALYNQQQQGAASSRMDYSAAAADGSTTTTGNKAQPRHSYSYADLEQKNAQQQQPQAQQRQQPQNQQYGSYAQQQQQPAAAAAASSSQYQPPPQQQQQNPLDISASSMDPSQRESTAYVVNLPNNLTEDVLYRHFEPCGAIDSAVIPRDKVTHQPKGYAFVNFSHPDSLLKAVQDLDGVELMGRCLSVSVKKSKPQPQAATQQQPSLQSAPPPPPAQPTQDKKPAQKRIFTGDEFLGVANVMKKSQKLYGLNMHCSKPDHIKFFEERLTSAANVSAGAPLGIMENDFQVIRHISKKHFSEWYKSNKKHVRIMEFKQGAVPSDYKDLIKTLKKEHSLYVGSDTLKGCITLASSLKGFPATQPVIGLFVRSSGRKK